MTDDHVIDIFEVEAMRDRIGYLEDRVEELEGMLGLTARFPVEMELSPTHEHLIGMLMSRPRLSHEVAFTGLYGDRPKNKRPADASVLGVHMMAVRQKLAPFSITVKTLHSFGWAINAADREKLKAMVIT